MNFLSLYLDSCHEYNKIDTNYDNTEIINRDEYRQMYAENYIIQKEIDSALDIYNIETRLYSESIGAIFAGIFAFLSKIFMFIMKLFLGIKGLIIGGVIALMIYLYKKFFGKEQTSYSGGGGGGGGGGSSSSSSSSSDKVINTGSTKSPDKLDTSGATMKNKVKPEELKENIKKLIKKDGNKLFKVDKDYREKSLNSKIKDNIVKNIKLKIEKKKKDDDSDKPKESTTPTEENIQEVLDNITPAEIDAIATETLKWYRYDTNCGEPMFWVKSEYKPELRERLKNFEDTGIFHDGVSVNDILKKNPLYSVGNLNDLQLMDIYKWDSEESYKPGYYDKFNLVGEEALYKLITDLDKLIAVVAVLEYRALYYISVMNGILGEDAIRANIDKVINAHLHDMPNEYRKATDSILKDLKNVKYGDSSYYSKDELMNHVIEIYKGCELHHLPFDFLEVNNLTRRGTEISRLQTKIKEISNFSKNPFAIGARYGSENNGYSEFNISSYRASETVDISLSFKLRRIIDLDEKRLTGLKNSVNAMFDFMQEHKRSLMDFRKESHDIDVNTLSDKEKEIMQCKHMVYDTCALGAEFSQMIASIVNVTYKILMNGINPVYDKIYEEIAFHVAEMGLQDVIHDVLKAQI